MAYAYYETIRSDTFMGDFTFLLIKAIFTGLFTGIIIAIPMGPAGIESVRWTMTKGFKYGLLIALGSLIADAIDIMLINFGLLELIDTNKLIEVFFWMLSGIVIFYIGYKAIHHRKTEEKNVSEGIVQKKTKKTHRPLFTGFIINFTNPMTHFFWLTLSSTVIKMWRSSGKLIYFIFSVALLTGMFTSLFLINFIASKGKKVAAPKLSGRFTVFLEYGIIAFGVGFFVKGLYVLINYLS